MIKIVSSPINIEEVMKSVQSDLAGGTVIFSGTVRNHSNGKKVISMEYDGYEEMALKKIKQIVDELQQQYSIENIAVVHRTGQVNIGEESVVIAVSAAHRYEAFKVCQEIIERIKQDVPIWKKEYFEDGYVWQDSHLKQN